MQRRKILEYKVKINAEERRKQWLERRKKGIGASDAPQILGYSEWGSPLSVFNEKTGKAQDFEMSERMEIGLLIEEFIAHLFKKKYNKKIRRREDEIYSKEHPFIFATIDRDIMNENAVLECKNIGVYSPDKWEGQIPDIYNIQCHQQMYVTGAEKVYLAALFGGNRFEVYEVMRDQSIIDWMIPELVSFWVDNVQAGIPPAANRIDSQFLTEQHFDATEDVVEVPARYEGLIREYNDLKSVQDNAKKRRDDIANELKQYIGDHRGLISGKYNVNWSRWTTNKFDSKRFKEENPDLYKSYLVKGKSGRINIKES